MNALLRRSLLAALTCGLAAAGPARADIIEQVLVKVNGDILTKTDLEARQIAKIRQQNRQVPSEDLPKVIADLMPEILEDAVDEMLLVQRGRELGYKLSDEQFKDIVDNIRKENNITTDAQFQQALKSENMTMEDLRRNLERQMLITRVQQTEIFGKSQLTDEETQQFYEEHKADFTKPATVSLREIFLGASAANEAAVGERANRIRAELAAGGDFAALARQYSEAPSKNDGGLVAAVTRAELAPALAEAITPLRPGEISQVIRTAKGFEILKLEASNPPIVTPFEQVRDQIRQRILENRRRTEADHYLKKLTADAVIEWKNDELKRIWTERTGGQEAARKALAEFGEAVKPNQPAPPQPAKPPAQPPKRPKPPGR